MRLLAFLPLLLGVTDIARETSLEAGLRSAIAASGADVAVAFRTLEKLAQGKAVGQKADHSMIEILERQKFNDAIPAGLPAGTVVAHKTGSITRINHDAGVVFARRPYVLVLLVRGIQEEKQSAALMARLSKAVYDSSQR